MLSRCCLFSLLLSATFGVARFAVAGNIVELPSDVSVSLTAQPNTALQPGDRVTFTISVTNNGPEVIDRLSLSSSFFRDQLDFFSATIGSCEGPLIGAVADGTGGYEYWIDWDPVTPNDPDLVTMDVGETRTCQFSMALTNAAPSVYTFSFRLADFLSDLDPSNDTASVDLQRSGLGGGTAAVPTLSPLALSILAGLLALLANIFRLTRHHRR